MASAFFAIALSGCAHSRQSEALPSANEVVLLQYDYQYMLDHLSCLRGDYEAVRRDTKLVLGERMEAIRVWSERLLGREALDEVMQSQFSHGFLVVGGCRIEAKTGKPVASRPRFEQQLQAFEKRIPDLRD